MGVETALLFCAIRANEMLGTLSFSRDPRAGYEIAVCMKRDGRLSTFCLTSPARSTSLSTPPVLGQWQVALLTPSRKHLRNSGRKIRAGCTLPRIKRLSRF
jgi:hypothetical protein